MSVGRNDPCPCGSGKKHKHCCLKSGGPEKTRRQRHIVIVAGCALALTILVGLTVSNEAGIVVGAVGASAIGLWLWLTTPPPAGGGGDPGAINFGR